jgi:hypothetical protein
MKMTSFRAIVLSSAALALLATSAAPAIAANITKPVSVSSAGDDMQSASDYHRRYRHHRDRVDAGDVIAGIGILAGIAIIADVASKAKKDKRRTSGDRYPGDYSQDRYPQDRSPEDRSDTRPYNPSGPSDRNYSAGNDLGAAVDACSRAAEQSAGGNARVEEIRSVTREGAGWQVLGRLNGTARGFSCTTSNGVVDTIRMDDGREI